MLLEKLKKILPNDGNEYPKDFQEIIQNLSPESDLNEEINFCSPCPDNIDFIYDKFYSNTKDNAIFVYLPTSPHRRANTFEFAKYISEKYNVPIVQKPFKALNEVKQHMSWKDFIELWSPCLYHFNLDPDVTQPGIQASLVANVGSINIGGENESHRILYPETATCDVNILEKRFVEYLNNPEKRFDTIKYAWEKLNEFYGSVVVKKQLLQVLNQK